MNLQEIIETSQCLCGMLLFKSKIPICLKLNSLKKCIIVKWYLSAFLGLGALRALRVTELSAAELHTTVGTQLLLDSLSEQTPGLLKPQPPG